MEDKKVNLTFKDLLLKEAKFVRSPTFGDKEYQITLQDNISVSNVKKNSFVITYERRTLENDPFELLVRYDVKVDVNDSANSLEGDIEKISEFAQKEAYQIVQSLALPARASVLIGNLTKELGTPYLTRPTIVK